MANRLIEFYRALRHCHQAIVRGGAPEVIFAQICQAAVDFGGMKMAWIGMIDANTQRLRAATAYGTGREYLDGIEISADASVPSGRGPIGIVIREDRPYWCNDYMNDPLLALWRDRGAAAGWAASAAVPLHRNGRVIGILGVYSAVKGAFDSELQDLLLGIAADLSFFLEREAARQVAAEQQKKYESRLEGIINAVADPVLVKDSESRIILANDAACRVMGLPFAAMAGKTLVEELTPEEMDFFLACDRRVLSTGVTETVEENLTSVTGKKYTLLTTKSRHIEPDGTRLLIAVLHDITGRKRQEEELRFQSRLLNSVGHAVICTDLAGEIIYLNEAAETMYGWPSTEARGRSVMEVTVPQTSRAQAEEIMNSLRKGHSWSGEFVVQRRDGKIFPVHVIDLPITDEHGKLSGILGVSTDITARKQAETELAHMQELLERTGKLAQVGGWQVDLATMKLSWTLETFRIAGIEPPGEPPLEEGINLFAPEARPVITAAIQDAINTGKSYDLELPIITRQGEHRWVLTQGFAEMKDGKAIRLYGTFQDITSRRQVEAERVALEGKLRQAKQLEALGTLAGGIAHDFNNIIATVMGYAKLAIEDTNLNKAAQESMLEIVKSTVRARTLVQQILAFSRQQPATPKVCEINAIVAEATKTLRNRLPPNVRLNVQLGENSPWARIDALQIEQVVINLGINAVQALAGRDGTISVSVDTVKPPAGLLSANPHLIEAADNLFVRIAVQDDGPGMDDKTLDRIFEPFFTTKPVNEGTGLGLSVAHGILQAHHGALTAESSPGAGATFYVYLPASDEPPDVQAPAEETAAKPTARTKHVLFLDDEESMVELVKRYLSRRGYKVTGFTRYNDALEAVRTAGATYDVFITDFNMPGISGLAVAEKVRTLQPSLCIAIVSGYIDDALTEKAAAAGIAAIIPKADGMEAFSDAVARLAESNGAQPS